MNTFIEKLECVYYPGPVPPDTAMLTVLCFVFDKIHFPGVHLPMGDYDKDLLQAEIARLEALTDSHSRSSRTVGLLRFLEYRALLDGILEYPTDSDGLFEATKRVDASLVRAIYDAHFPPRPNFEPSFNSAFSKALPGGDEGVNYFGDFYYQANAIQYANERHLPLLDDGSGLRLPFRAPLKDNVQSLATMLAVECVAVGIPQLPILTARQLVDFRVENQKELESFRSAMLRFAKTLNGQIDDETPLDEVGRKAQALVASEIEPALHDLKRDLMNPNRPFYKRMLDLGSVVASMGVGWHYGGILGSVAAGGIQKMVQAEIESRGDKAATARRSGLYYVLKARSLNP